MSKESSQNITSILCALITGILGLIAVVSMRPQSEKPKLNEVVRSERVITPAGDKFPNKPMEEMPQSTPEATKSPSIAPPLSLVLNPSITKATVLLLPIRDVSSDPASALPYLRYAHDCIRARLISLGLVTVADREDLGAIETELQYLGEMPKDSLRKSITKEAFETASKFGARWLVVPVLSVDIIRVERTAYTPRPDISTATVKITLYIIDLLSRTYAEAPEAEETSDPEYVRKSGPAVSSETIHRLIDLTSTSAVKKISF